MKRRSLLLGTIATYAAGMPTADAQQPSTYEEAARLVWRPLDPARGALELVRAATLAANSHNTQPWRFTLAANRITIRPDLHRRCPAVDPDDHHLFASLGCAAENLVQAAAMLGLNASVDVDTVDPGSVVIALDRTAASNHELAEAITQRQCTRAKYDGTALSSEELRAVENAGSLCGVECLIVTERSRMEAILDYVIQGNTAQMRDPAFMAELISWIRFNDAAAIERLDGLAARSSGNPALPAWLARHLLRFVFTEKGEQDKYAEHVRSSAGIAIFVAPHSDKAGWVAAGRAYQRFALQATTLGIRNACLNQPVEVPFLRLQIAAYLELGDRRPDLIVRFGRGAKLPPSLRRPVSAVIDAA
ncbi:Tat pathway signal protein [Bradyrhizobium sp. CCGUVB23]|uniref:Acg family FMN-binding oxidoreductase n=1 Tax=Bradyrhizobium sp. CCGUVB23 TaxID=2949630 RepID=UPI0020B35C59|nr:Tat pathway signal protein [Bradyrhizobium sp. CCGUVB23]MCP3463364.1 Tat pathway signal protein [Bradyrhizobium sp. CCGUVB23]